MSLDNLRAFDPPRRPHMRRIHRVLVGIVALAALPLAAQREARMELPDDLAARVERLSVEGFGGRNEGNYTLGELGGEFTRIESRWAVADPVYAQNRGKSSFSLSGPGLASSVAGTCEMRRASVTVGIVTFDPDKMTYQCDLAGSSEAPLLVLGQPKPDNFRARVLARAERRGEARFGGVTLAVQSVHRYDGSRLQSQTPVGYLLAIGDRAVGAVELTDVDPAVYLPAAEAADVRAAVIVTALALAVLRDPATSALED
jgi:hypothetical protein